jgi:septal ring factor EnvC (AmiA/AmiB activator)
MVITLSASAQDRTALEKKREKLLEEIRYTERLLSKTRKDASTTTADISALRRKIKLREDLMGSLKAEVNAINREVRSNQREVDALNNQLEKLRENYAQSIYNSYKYQKANQQLLFILGAESFNQAYRRLNYLRKLNQRRKEQASEMEATAEQINKKIGELNSMKREKNNLLAENTVQMKSLEAEKAEKDKFVARLKQNESRYRDEIRKKDDEAKKLDKEIRLIIERELAAKEKSADGLERTPEAIAALSREFVANKGKLPWPVERGYVSRRHGKHSHPELSNIQVDNNGIDIRTSKDSPVRAVFNGEVVSVFTNPMFKHAVIVKHGEYFTVYTKLGSVKVKQGDRVSTRQLIGYAYTDNDVAEVHLEVWKGKTNLDPYTWIARK